jgi:DNA-binding winged helix-turn-helix (wHTH) protein
LRKHGLRVKIQAQPFLVLAALLEKPGSVVTRDELRGRLWPDDTFVDFEHGLNAAVTRLRQALGDSAEQPRYIETLAKRGYRFIANTELLFPRVNGPPHHASGSVSGRRSMRWLGAVALVLAAAGGFGTRYFAARNEPREWRAVPLTTFPGREVHPALSPDGRYVAFSWNGEKQNNFDIYVMPVDSGTLVRLTTDPAGDLSPACRPMGAPSRFCAA